MADTERTQSQMLEELKKMSESMTGIKSDTDVIGLAGGVFTKLIQKMFGSVVDAVKTFDAIRVSNADLNVNFYKIRREIIEQKTIFGDVAEHMQTQLNLHRIGYKDLNFKFRDQLIFLDRTDKMGDQITVLKALGLDDEMLMTVLKAAEEMPQTNAASLGKFVAEMIQPKDITKSILLGTYQSGRDLLRQNATVQERVATITKAASEASERAQGFLKQAGPDPFLLKTFKNTFVGSTGILAMQVDAAQSLKESTGMFGTDITFVVH